MHADGPSWQHLSTFLLLRLRMHMSINGLSRPSPRTCVARAPAAPAAPRQRKPLLPTRAVPCLCQSGGRRVAVATLVTASRAVVCTRHHNCNQDSQRPHWRCVACCACVLHAALLGLAACAGRRPSAVQTVAGVPVPAQAAAGQPGRCRGLRNPRWRVSALAAALCRDRSSAERQLCVH